MEESHRNKAAADSEASMPREGLRIEISDAEARDRALDMAVNYRGDVTLHLRGGEAVAGYAYDRSPATPAREAVLRILPAEGSRRAVPCGDITAVEFTGRDTASGRSFETWIRKYVGKKLAGEPAENSD